MKERRLRKPRPTAGARANNSPFQSPARASRPFPTAHQTICGQPLGCLPFESLEGYSSTSPTGFTGNGLGWFQDNVPGPPAGSDMLTPIYGGGRVLSVQTTQEAGRRRYPKTSFGCLEQFEPLLKSLLQI